MEVLRALGALAEPPGAGSERLAAELELGELPSKADHTELFSFQLVPYASVYLDPSGHMGGEARDRIAGFWRAIGLRPPSEPDHLTTLLSTYATWVEATGAAAGGEARARWRHRITAFLGEHLLSWLPTYLLSLRRIDPAPFYRRWAELLWSCLESEQHRLDPPPGPSQHHRLTDPLAAAELEATDSAGSALLAPIRSGLVLTRRDLACAARESGLAGRIGERRFMLEAMQRQDPTAIRRWIVEHAEATRSAYDEVSGPLVPSFDAWSRRLANTISILRATAST